MVFAYSTCFSERFASLLSASSLARINSELSGVRSSWLMFARNSLLYFEISESCSAFSSRLARASSTSRFFTSMFAFCSSSCLAFSSSSSACFPSAELLRFSSSCWMVSSFDCVCSSCVRPCDCCRSSSVLMFAPIMLSTTPIDSVSWSRKIWWMAPNGLNDASSITAFTSPSKRTGRTMMFSGGASPRPELIWM